MAKNTEQTDVDKFGTSDTETQKAASVAAARTAPVTGTYGDAVGSRQDAISKALSERETIIKQAAKEVPAQADAEAANTTALMNDLEAPLKAPVTNPLQKPLQVTDVGIHPDVTSPVNLFAAQAPALPGTGVADPRDLAPGQDMSPSPPVSSSNILPNPDKPGTNFSRL